MTRRADLSPTAAFFTTGDGPKLVYCPRASLSKVRVRVGQLATVIAAGDEVEPLQLCEDLGARGVRRLMVEGGTSVLTQFLLADLADELQLAVAPVFVGDARAPRFVSDGEFPWRAERRARLVEAHAVGDVVVHRYALSARFGAT